MADDVNPALRAEIGAALVVIGPQIDGLRDLSRIEASEEFISFVVDEYNAQVERERLLNAVIGAMDAVNGAMRQLEADGYPAVTVVTGAPVRDIEQQKAESDAAYALLASVAPASQIKVNFGAPVDPSSKK